MDAARKEQLKTQWRDQQRNAAVAALPLPAADLKAMFDMLDVELPAKGCDRSRRLTEAWLASNGYDLESVCKWMDSQGGYCDCEVLANVEGRIDDAERE
jgi:hypothetical protein